MREPSLENARPFTGPFWPAKVRMRVRFSLERISIRLWRATAKIGFPVMEAIAGTGLRTGAVGVTLGTLISFCTTEAPAGAVAPASIHALNSAICAFDSLARLPGGMI